MDNNIKFNNGGGLKYFISELDNNVALTNPVGVDCYIGVCAYQFSVTTATSFKINSTSITKETGSQKSGDITNDCYIAEFPKGATATLTYEAQWAKTNKYFVSTNKPKLINSVPLQNTTKTINIQPTKDVLCIVSGFSNNTTISFSGGEYIIVQASSSGKTIFIPKGEAVAVTLNGYGAVSVFEI